MWAHACWRIRSPRGFRLVAEAVDGTRRALEVLRRLVGLPAQLIDGFSGTLELVPGIAAIRGDPDFEVLFRHE